ncbi:hypothetical protein BJ170DRAFT_588079 [Xylariales sp. AK1849]|nr:hypothetical protein BJ170DRAFT_588079 [Xylariales sp. AK1849]
MADDRAPPPPASQPSYQTPAWETPSPSSRRSILGRFLPSRANDAPSTSTTAQSAASPTHASAPATGTGVSGSSMWRRFDSILPPNRTYLGRSRRSLLLFILLPLATLLFVVLPLAIGLGVGLSRRSSGGSQDLPLPSNTDTFSGDLTYYGPGLGACGVESTSEDDIVSVSHILFDAASTGSNPNANPLCKKKIRISRDFVEMGSGNRSVDVTVVDRCTGCAETDLDVSLGVFTQLALEESGRVTMSWAWLN